jgi:phosphatidylglycerol lysyltransferase
MTMTRTPPEDRVRELVLRHGWNATAYQIVNPGIRHWFSRNGDAVIGYVEAYRMRVVAGAPVCPLVRLPDVLDEWERDTRRAGQGICYFGAAGRVETLLGSRPDHSTVVLGAQPVWRPSEWAGILGGHASLRAQLHRSLNKGVRVSEWPSEKAENHPALCRCLQEWLGTRGLPPLHFLVEPETLSNLAGRRVFVAERDGGVVGFLVLSPVPKRKGWLTEQFPRGRRAPNGTVELLLDHAIRTVAAEGSEYVTMGLVPLSGHGGPPTAYNPEWLRMLLAWVRAHGRRFYNFEGLEAFKAKFLPPYWEPIYAISKEPRFSPHSLYAIAGAFSGCSPVLAVARGLGRAVRQEVAWMRDRL